MSNKTWMYKGKKSKIFEEEELKEAMMKGWVDNPAEANRSPEELAADLAILEKGKRAALEEAERLVKEKEGAASGATTFKNKE